LGEAFSKIYGTAASGKRHNYSLLKGSFSFCGRVFAVPRVLIFHKTNNMRTDLVERGISSCFARSFGILMERRLIRRTAGVAGALVGSVKNF
jgi:hypothetical protein